MQKDRPSITQTTRKAFQHTGLDMALYLYGIIDYALDLETTGIDIIKDEAIQLGVIELKTTKVLLNHHFLPTVPISAGAQRIHGKDEQWLKDNNAVKFEEVYEEVAASLKGKVIAGYNVAFDACILDNMCARRGLPPLEVGMWVDLMPCFTLIKGRWSTTRKGFAWPKLAEFNIHKLELHDAISDCLVICNYLQHIKSKVK